jgi:hypothetical protein
MERADRPVRLRGRGPLKVTASCLCGCVHQPQSVSGSRCPGMPHPAPEVPKPETFRNRAPPHRRRRVLRRRSRSRSPATGRATTPMKAINASGVARTRYSAPTGSRIVPSRGSSTQKAQRTSKSTRPPLTISARNRLSRHGRGRFGGVRVAYARHGSSVPTGGRWSCTHDPDPRREFFVGRELLVE